MHLQCADNPTALRPVGRSAATENWTADSASRGAQWSCRWFVGLWCSRAPSDDTLGTLRGSEGGSRQLYWYSITHIHMSLTKNGMIAYASELVRTSAHVNKMYYLLNWCVGHDAECCGRCAGTGRRCIFAPHPLAAACSGCTAGRRRPTDSRRPARDREIRKRCAAAGAPWPPPADTWWSGSTGRAPRNAWCDRDRLASRGYSACALISIKYRFTALVLGHNLIICTWSLGFKMYVALSLKLFTSNNLALKIIDTIV